MAQSHLCVTLINHLDSLKLMYGGPLNWFSHPVSFCGVFCFFLLNDVIVDCNIIFSTKYLHCTSSLALAFTEALRPLSAEHQYVPDWFLFASKLSSSPIATALPSLSQTTFGAGFPVAEQSNFASVPSRMVWLVGNVSRLGGTVPKETIVSLFKGTMTTGFCWLRCQSCAKLRHKMLVQSSGDIQ